jgi:hypothetical protein
MEQVYTFSNEVSPWRFYRTRRSKLIREFRRGNRADNIERARTYYERALEVLDQDKNRLVWAGVQAGLAIAYRERIEGNRSENLESALAHQYKAAMVFTDFLEVAETEDWGHHVYQLFHLFSKLTGVSLQSYYGSIAENLYLGVFDLSPVFQELPLRFDEQFPIVFLATNSLSEDDLERFRESLSDHVGPSNRRALFILGCGDKELSTIREQLSSGATATVHAYDIVCFSHQDLKRIVMSVSPCKDLRQVILSRVDLTRVSAYNPSGATSREMFFGREQELQRICDRVVSDNFVLIGGRRIGKTSILKQLECVRLPDAGFHAFYHECSFTPTQEELVVSPINS